MDISYISENGTPKKLLIFQQIDSQAQKTKQKHSEKMSHISGENSQGLSN